METLGVMLQLLQGRLGVLGIDGRVAQLRQRGRGELADVGVVLHHQHAGAVAVAVLLLGRLGNGWARPSGPGKIQGEGGSPPRLALDQDVAPGLFGEPEHLAETQPGALADALGGVEGLEDAIQLVGGDAMAGIADGDGDEVALDAGMGAHGRHVAAGADLHLQRPLPVHGVAGVRGHVDDGGVELARVRVDEAGLVRRRERDVDARAGQGGDHAAHRLQVGVHVEQLGLQGLPAREGEQLAGQLGGAVGGVGDGVGVAGAPLLAEARPAQQVHRAADHRQQVVEVVGHPAGELADRLQLLGLAQRVLGVVQRLGLEPVAGDVPAADIELVALRHRHPGHPAIAAVLVALPVLEAQDRLGGLQLHQRLFRRRMVVGVEQGE